MNTLPLIIATLFFRFSANSNVDSELITKLPVKMLLEANKSSKSASKPSKEELIASTSSPEAMLSICDSNSSTAVLMSARPSARAVSTAVPMFP